MADLAILIKIRFLAFCQNKYQPQFLLLIGNNSYFLNQIIKHSIKLFKILEVREVEQISMKRKRKKKEKKKGKDIK